MSVISIDPHREPLQCSGEEVMKRESYKPETLSRRRYQTGQLIDDKDRWCARWREDVLQPDGKVKRIRKWDVLATKRSCPNKRQAQRLLEEKLRLVNSAEYRPLSGELFSTFSERWKAQVLKHNEPSTQETTAKEIRKLVTAFGSLTWSEITAEVLQKWVSSLELSPKTIRNHVFTLRAMWKTAKAWKCVTHNPFDELKLPKKKKAKAYTFSPEEMMQIINEAQGQNRLIFEIFAFGGVRPGEQAGLRPEDLNGRTLSVRQAVYKGKVKESLKSENAARNFPIPEWLAVKIREHVEASGPNRHGLIFVNGAGNPINTNHFNDKVLKPILKRLGIWQNIPEGTRCGNYAFRHGNISAQRNNGIPLATIQARVGHAPGSKVTDEHYVEADPKQSYAAADLLDALLNPNVGGSVQ